MRVLRIVGVFAVFLLLSASHIPTEALAACCPIYQCKAGCTCWSGLVYGNMDVTEAITLGSKTYVYVEDGDKLEVELSDDVALFLQEYKKQHKKSKVAGWIILKRPQGFDKDVWQCIAVVPSQDDQPDQLEKDPKKATDNHNKKFKDRKKSEEMPASSS